MQTRRETSIRKKKSVLIQILSIKQKAMMFTAIGKTLEIQVNSLKIWVKVESFFSLSFPDMRNDRNKRG